MTNILFHITYKYINIIIVEKYSKSCIKSNKLCEPIVTVYYLSFVYKSIRLWCKYIIVNNMVGAYFYMYLKYNMMDDKMRNINYTLF